MIASARPYVVVVYRYYYTMILVKSKELQSPEVLFFAVPLLANVVPAKSFVSVNQPLTVAN